jgi:hypothetical protein
MKTPVAILILAAVVWPALAYDLNIADCPTTATNATATASLPYVNVTRASQFALCLTASMGTTLNGTNPAWYPGTVTCTASNSFDTITWFPDAVRSFSFAVPTNGVVTLQTNFTGLGAIGYEQYTVAISNNVNLTWTTATKPGL